MLTFLSPFRCVLCGAQSQSGFDLCCVCENNLTWMEQVPHCRYCAIDLAAGDKAICGECLQQSPIFDHIIPAVAYDKPVGFLLQQLKFYHQLTHSRVVAQLLIKALKNELAACSKTWPSVIIPIPLHWQRQIKRGFNQSLEIARFVGKALNIPVEVQAVNRKQATQAQSGLTAKRRVANVHRAFEVSRNNLPDHVALLDDVLTTGATVNAVAKALKQSGVKQVDVWCVARALKKS